MTPPAATAAGRALPRTAVPRAPRRVSGPAPRRREGAPTRRRSGTATGEAFAPRALRRARLLADSRLLDRLVRGQLWIPLVAVGLMGIVFMQVTMLKFNSGIGRAVEAASTLERQNSDLRSEVSSMESGTRIDAVAHRLGMVVPADGGEHYVRAGAADTAQVAARTMTPPDPTALARAQAAAAAGTVATTPAATTPVAPVATTTAAPTATTAATAPVQAPATTPVAQTPAATPTPTPAVTPVVTQQSTTPAAGATVAPTTQQPPAATTAAATSGGSAAPAGN